MSNYKFNPEHLYENTNKGLDIIFKYCPEAIGCENGKKQFKLRQDEDTASASIVEKETCFIVKDFGDKGYNPIELCRYFTGFSFIEALRFLYSEFGLGENVVAIKPVTTFEAATDQPKGWFEIIENTTHSHIDLIGRFVNENIALQYDFISVKSYSFLFFNKKTQLNTICKIEATEHYPIYAYHFCDDWAKIYQPLDKKYKHSFIGKKPARHVYGLTRLREVYNESLDNIQLDIDKAKKEENDRLEDELTELKLNFKLPAVIICSGGTDGLTVASLGYDAIWFNSESEQLNFEEYKELKTLCKEVYNLPDIDGPGTKYGYQVAEMFWNLKTIWLPEVIKEHKGKDLRDWVKRYSKSDLKTIQFHFANLITGALKTKFFERNPKTKSVKIKPSYLHYFLKVKGFYLYYPDKIYANKSNDQEFIFIRIVENIIHQHFPNTIRKFCEKYLIEKGQPVEVIDIVKSTTAFTDKNLMSLDSTTLNFSTYDAESQTFFLKNNFATVTAEGIVLKPYKDLKTHVWSDKILKYNIMPCQPFFKVEKDENGVEKLTILSKECEYMNFLINTSRTSWRKELEIQFEGKSIEEKKAYHDTNRFEISSPYLTDEENAIQEQHFKSKLFAIGYLLHKYKRQSFARMVYIMDDMQKESEDERNGGSGKSLILKGIDCLLPKRVVIDGMLQNLLSNPFILGEVTKENDYILLEDLAEHYPIEPYYNWITGSLNINPKFKQGFELNFFDAPKIAVTRNFGLKGNLASSLRRILFLSTSDYYHNIAERYNEERRVSHDFNKDLLLWDEKSTQPTIHYNFLMQCLQYYLQNREAEILAPENNIHKNNLAASFGDAFKDWAEGYFSETQIIADDLGIDQVFTGTLNEYVLREEMQNSYKNYAGKFAKTAPKFKSALKDYCKMKNWTFNPKEKQGSDGLIKKAVIDEKGKRQTKEHFFIVSHFIQPEPTPEPIEPKPSDDLPF